jgi:GT2 family glycosyltransferase
MFLNMEKFEKIGFFDKNFFLYFEEIDLCRRVIDNKEKIFLDPSIEINHDGGKSVNQSFSYQIELTRNWHWMWSTFYYHKKYDGFFIAGLKVSQKFFSAFFKSIFYTISLNKEKKEIYLHRLSGLVNSILGRSSWHRPTLD